jgi:NLI interacting factor-like phosphatase
MTMISSLRKREQLFRLKKSIVLYWQGKGSLALGSLATVLPVVRTPVVVSNRSSNSIQRRQKHQRGDMSTGIPLPPVPNDNIKKKADDAFYDRAFSAGKEAMRTGSVLVIQPTKQRHKKPKHDDPPNYRSIRVTTSSTFPTNETRDFPSTEVRFNVKPLIVLDLNGILCYRIRRQLKFENQELVNTVYPYRPQLGPDIAQTPIIPRPDVTSFLEYLDAHFCLAIWTSAKTKTANALIKLLIPEPVRDRLLFIWSQAQCEASAQLPESTIPSNTVVYRKNLASVWQKYPLWSTCNTLLIDDSPDKCTCYKENSIHPPSINGRHVPPTRSFVHPMVQMSDDENVAKQLAFMQKLVHHWNTFSVVQTWDSRNSDYQFQVLTGAQHDMKSFLVQHATGHMGYHVST